jgi:mannose/fructose/N-acetylgalactosamine-specific phosphotransferase system component IIC
MKIIPYILVSHNNKLRKMKKASIVIFLIGLVLTIFTTITYFTKEKVVDLGKIEISRDKPHTFNWSPLIGIAVMGVGGLLYWQAGNKK